MKCWKTRNKGIAAAVMATLALAAVCWLGRGEYGSLRKNADSKTEETGAALEVQEAGQQQAPVLGEEQLSVVKAINQALEQENRKEAVRILEQQQDLLAGMFYETLKGGRYLFDGEELRPLTEGEGLVFTKPGALFFGSFAEGKPEGECLALQLISFEAPRCDYSSGFWKAGKMEGSGVTGYCYYEAVPENQPREIKKTGTFKGNMMDGTILYESTSPQGETVKWEVTAKDGVTQLDESWIYLEKEGEYQLPSSENGRNAYILSKDQVSQPVWRNLIEWEE